MPKQILICLIFLLGIFLLIGFSQAQCDLTKWGDSCQYSCSSHCYHGNECTGNGGNCGCDKTSGACFKCEKDFYGGDLCTLQCGANCSLSDQCLQSGLGCGCERQYGNCNSCPKNLWGTVCERSCSDNCINSECNRTNSDCSLGCVTGFYGSSCSLTCPTSCQYGCDMNTAACFPSHCVNCKGGLAECDTTAQKCKSGCIDGFYGDSCDQSCVQATNINLCTKCNYLSVVGLLVCVECQSGYFIDINNQCKLCSTGCQVNSTTVAKCFPNNGKCRFGCTPGWSGSNCDLFTCAVTNCDTCSSNNPTVCLSCQTGWYLQSGQCIRCSDNCATVNSCDKVSGTCVNGCKNGWYGNKCIDSCTTNCLQGECDSKGICTQGCNGKRYGQKCDLLCSNCLTACNRNSGVCDSTCIDGYHGSDCSIQCPSNCLSNKCNQGDGKCTIGCKTGLYGETCQLPCGSGCADSTCMFSTGACMGNCLSGKYGEYCDQDCPTHCSPKICEKTGGACSSSCKEGFYGSHCNIQCPTTCSTNECYKNEGTCTADCPTGKYGTRCELACNSNCNGTSCDKLSGSCNDGCKHGYYGSACHDTCGRCDSLGCNQVSGECIGKCVNGYYGNKCNQMCSIGCQSSACEKNSGKCSPCKDGYYNEKCAYQCSANCKLSKCNQTSGLCTEGCIAGRYGAACDNNCNDCTVCDQNNGKCDGCVAGKYGTHCDKNCSQNCAVSSSGSILCHGVDGFCLNGCTGGWYGSLCSISCNNDIHCIENACDRHSADCSGNCVTGWYGSKCTLKCSENCNGNICERISGNCTQNCTPGFYGTDCTIPCHSTCTLCDVNSGICTKCKPGFYGNNCNSQCSSKCSLYGITAILTVCNKDTGICTGGCKNGWYGTTCKNQCSPYCADSKCELDSGKCTNGCGNDKYGEYCENSCTNCAGTSNANCDINNGHCIHGCDNGYFGSSCTQDCSQNCKNKKCLSSKNNCSLGCNNGLYGPSCTQSCNTHCLNNVCIQTTGRCTDGCVRGWFGDKCKYNCPVHCVGGVCDRVAGTCIDLCAGNECEGTTIKDETDVDLAVIIGASFGGAVALFFILIIICWQCCRTRNKRKGGSEDVLTPRSDSLDGIDNQQFGNFDEIKKDDWVLRSTVLYEQPKQNGILIPISEADAQTTYYDLRPAPVEDYGSDETDTESSVNEDMSPPPPAVHFSNFDGRDGIQVEMFPQYVEYMLNKENSFENEYNDLPYGLRHPHDIALKPGNKSKNRYKNIYAYDHARVILVPELDSSDDEQNTSVVKKGTTDYINASYFDGYNESQAYIACQGPTDEMVDDFWRMIWQLRIQNIVMLTNVVEAGVDENGEHVKCKKYWPDENKTDRYGTIYVRFDYQEVFSDFILTNLVVTKDNARLQVKHLQFTSWPDKDVPKYVTPLVEFYCKVKSLHREGPLLAHCSAGVGRSGTFLGLDYLMDQADNEGKVNIYRCVEKMRISRPNMVQTPGQYIFLHQALSEALLTRESPVDEDEFENYYNQMQLKDPRSGLTRLQHEFTQLKSQKVKNVFEAAKMEENKHRNRHKNILASDECRVFLWSKIKGCTDYINAIYLPSYRNKYCYIATEMPQCSSIVDFCRMIFQEEVRTIVMLDNNTSGINVNDHYWPNPKQTMECGPFSIKVTEEKDYKDYVIRSLNFKYEVDPESKSEMLHVLDQKGTYKVNQFHFKCWSEGKVTPTSVDSFLNLIRAVTDWQSDSVKHPIIVHCLDGATKVGLFCLVKACLDRLHLDGDVSVIHALHHMKARRQQVVPNYEQYKFCHDCILRQILSGDS